MKTNPNDSAFSRQAYFVDGGGDFGAEGLTKREYFAAMAMQGLLANSYNDGVYQPLSTASHDQIANMAVRLSDSFIVALNEEKR